MKAVSNCSVYVVREPVYADRWGTAAMIEFVSRLPEPSTRGRFSNFFGSRAIVGLHVSVLFGLDSNFSCRKCFVFLLARLHLTNPQPPRKG